MNGPVGDLTSFGRTLRHAGIPVTQDQVGGMARALTLVDPADAAQFRAALRSLAVSDPTHIPVFDKEFDRFFLLARDPATVPSSEPFEVKAVVPLIAPPETSDSDDELASQEGASATERISSRDFADLDESQLAEARRLVATMFWRPARFRTRRWVPDRSGRRPDLRRTLQRSIGAGGEMMPIEHRSRRERRRPLIIIADVSGSMERYAELFMVFAHAARQHLGTVEVFTFSTRLTRVTDELARRDIRTALTAVGSRVDDWSGGTKIGEAFAAWNRAWSRRMARGGPVALVLSDGWDCGDPELLAAETARLARSVHRLIWLNPLAGRPGYRPETRGMRAALPHVDHLLPAGTVDDLADLVALLDTMVHPLGARAAS